jgi:O-antigen ligase
MPLLLLLSQNIKGVDLKWAMRGLILAILVSGIHLLVRAMMNLFSGFSLDEWTYHAFTSPYEIGAIYYSWYLTIALFYLMFSKPGDLLMEKYRDILIIFITLLLMASASKLFVVVTVPSLLLYFIFRSLRSKMRWLVVSVLSLAVLVGTVPFMNRMAELKNFDLDVVWQEQYSFDTPLNGLTLRLIQWRMGFEIIQEENAWLFGVGPGNAQLLLDKKYAADGLYTGNGELGDTGYLGFNFHNQYIESLVETGFPGMILLIMLLAGATFIYKKLLIFPRAVFLVTILFLITESVVERQAGILVFSMIISFAPAGNNHLISKQNTR